jgi:hypothetical protein
MRLIFKNFIYFTSLVFVGVLILLSLSPVNSSASESELEINDVEAMSEAELEESVQIFIRTRETERILELRDLYRDQINVYRDTNRAFEIARAQHQQVDTLQSLEQAVNATRTVMYERSRVLITYLELLREVLNNTAGAELSLKQEILNELVTTIETLKLHQEQIQLGANRNDVARLADEFEPISKTYTQVAYKALSVIRIARIQTVADKAEIIKADIVTIHQAQEANDLVKSRRDRAYREIDRDLESTKNTLESLNQRVISASASSSLSASFFNRILTDLGPVYAQISRSLNHIRELTRI